MMHKRKKESFGFINLLLALGLIVFCLIFLGGTGTENKNPQDKISNEVKFASQIVAGLPEKQPGEWIRLAEKHPDLIIRAASDEVRE